LLRRVSFDDDLIGEACLEQACLYFHTSEACVVIMCLCLHISRTLAISDNYTRSIATHATPSFAAAG
jgi:hypothetical protein